MHWPVVRSDVDGLLQVTGTVQVQTVQACCSLHPRTWIYIYIGLVRGYRGCDSRHACQLHHTPNTPDLFDGDDMPSQRPDSRPRLATLVWAALRLEDIQDLGGVVVHQLQRISLWRKVDRANNSACLRSYADDLGAGIGLRYTTE